MLVKVGPDNVMKCQESRMQHKKYVRQLIWLSAFLCHKNDEIWNFYISFYIQLTMRVHCFTWYITTYTTKYAYIFYDI